MSKNEQAVRIVSAEVVREWARKRGIQVAEHGRLNAEVVSKFNAAHKAQAYVVTRSQPARVIKVSGTPKAKGAFAPKVETTIPKVRKWAHAAGLPVGARGRIPAEVLTAYADRGGVLPRSRRKVNA